MEDLYTIEIRSFIRTGDINIARLMEEKKANHSMHSFLGELVSMYVNGQFSKSQDTSISINDEITQLKQQMMELVDKMSRLENPGNIAPGVQKALQTNIPEARNNVVTIHKDTQSSLKPVFEKPEERTLSNQQQSAIPPMSNFFEASQ